MLNVERSLSMFRVFKNPPSAVSFNAQPRSRPLKAQPIRSREKDGGMVMKPPLGESKPAALVYLLKVTLTDNGKVGTGGRRWGGRTQSLVVLEVIRRTPLAITRGRVTIVFCLVSFHLAERFPFSNDFQIFKAKRFERFVTEHQWKENTTLAPRSACFSSSSDGLSAAPDILLLLSKHCLARTC